MTALSHTDARQVDVLQQTDFRLLLTERFMSALAGVGFATLIGYQLYIMTGDPLSLGLLGLVEAIPAIALSLIGGYVADRMNRKRIVLTTTILNLLCMLTLMYIARNPEDYGLVAIYSVVAVIGFAVGFFRPASSAFEQQVIPIHQAARGASLTGSMWLTGGILGGPLAGFSIDLLGIPATYGLIALLMAIAFLCFVFIPARPVPPPEEGETLWQSLRAGVRFVWHSQPLVGSMALDLFAVLFGGAMALLPIFATDILDVGARGLGFLRTAPSIGALLVMAMATRRAPTNHAGRNLLWCVGGFGVSMIVFGLSRSFVLSLVALFFAGVFDGVSMIIREVILRVLSPEAMRGRIASVSWLFIGASNELGAFESGVVARLLGTAPSVIAGGSVTLVVVTVVAATLPELRRLRLPDKGNS
ncbi:MAG TPA: MFS transporter [Caldilineaceae bacterium]|nr:MFS transporter [Caldilineaceae bacterium]